MKLEHHTVDRRRLDQLLVFNPIRPFVELKDMNDQMIFGSKVHQLVCTYLLNYHSRKDH